ncbi:hypothetical protein AB0H42_03060 [Nocardia sp. NPDC050799]|uniref:hypothetical protein n=1 Tax=Nocardia sp. NPDC050799 TaxID=3154842 RepID=UPI0033D277C2
MDDQDQYARYAADRQVLRTIGAHLGSEVGRVEVRIPRAMAEYELVDAMNTRLRQVRTSSNMAVQLV